MNPAEAVACQGAWCALRERCARYHAPFPAREKPFERLCRPPGNLMFWEIKPEPSPKTRVNHYIANAFPKVAGTFPPFEVKA